MYEFCSLRKKRKENLFLNGLIVKTECKIITIRNGSRIDAEAKQKIPTKKTTYFMK